MSFLIVLRVYAVSNVKHTIQVDPQVLPVNNRARQTPISRIEKVKAELKRMEVNGIIEKVDQPTP